MSDLHAVLPPEAQPKPEPDCPAHDTRCTPDECKAAGPSTTLADILNTFKYHNTSDEQVERISNIRDGAMAFAGHIWTNVPPGPDRTVALRKLHEAMMTANKAIVCEGPTNG